MILLVTNIISELMRPEPDAVVLRWMAAQKDALYVTALSCAEILFGIDLLPKGRRRQRLGEQATAMFTEDFAGRIWVFDVTVAPAYAAIAAKRQKAGKRLGSVDAMIAAIAHVHGASIATRDGDRRLRCAADQSMAGVMSRERSFADQENLPAVPRQPWIVPAAAAPAAMTSPTASSW